MGRGRWKGRKGDGGRGGEGRGEVRILNMRNWKEYQGAGMHSLYKGGVLRVRGGVKYIFVNN